MDKANDNYDPQKQRNRAAWWKKSGERCTERKGGGAEGAEDA